jgi:hypothetical protein
MLARRPRRPRRPRLLARPPPLLARRPRRLAHPQAWPALAGLGLGLLALGPALAPGYVLSYDMVFLPHAPISAATLGLAGGPPRAVPSDAVIAALSAVVPADLVQKVVLVAIIAAACAGAAGLLARCAARTGRAAPLLARLAAGVCYAWNPFVAERLILGQWALLLGYAGLPWVVSAVWAGDRPVRLARLGAALIPAAVGGYAAIGISALAAVPVALAGGAPGRTRRVAVVLAALGVASLPWLIPALLVGVHTDPGGADAFAARPDTPFGRAGSLLLLGGTWNEQVVPRGYGGPGTAAWLLVILVAVAGYALLGWRRGACPGLGSAGIIGFAVAAIGLTSPSLAVLRDLIAAWPGFGVLRDGQQYLAPLALAEAIGLGLVAAWLSTELAPSVSTEPAPPDRELAPPDRELAPAARELAPAAGELAPAAGEPAAARELPAGRGGPGSRRAATALAVMAAVAPVLLLPGLAWGAAGRLHAVQYPADWLRARQVIDGDPRPGSVVLLPWAAYRRFRWNDGGAVLDPWTKLLSRPLIWNDALQVGDQTVATEYPAARRLTPVIAGAGPLTGALRSAGVRYVIVDAGPLLSHRGTCLAQRARLPGATIVVASPDLLVFRLPAAGPGAQAAGPGRHQFCPDAGR